VNSVKPFWFFLEELKTKEDKRLSSEKRQQAFFFYVERFWDFSTIYQKLYRYRSKQYLWNSFFSANPLLPGIKST